MKSVKQNQHLLAVALRSIVDAAPAGAVANPQSLGSICANLVWLTDEDLSSLDAVVKFRLKGLPDTVLAAARQSKLRARRETAALHRKLGRGLAREQRQLASALRGAR